ncbi:hypothetical protein DPEC_G00089150 [Dallia pectoralis]|uniref:Uncharacterized protein n=1 Tax=Dallia pectoralis TaxID=75939 RepID=A0ACC2H0A6_DALPE|nr:hypothetical protein DPEC_G00089150 [Dallia pectoralis]
MNRMKLKPDGDPGLHALNKVQLDQVSRRGSSTRTSILPSLHNSSFAASEERRRKVLSSTDALLRRYNLLPDSQSGKPEVTKPVGLKPKGRKVKASESRFPPIYESGLLALSLWSGKRFLPSLNWYRRCKVVSSTSLRSPPRQYPSPEDLKGMPCWNTCPPNHL